MNPADPLADLRAYRLPAPPDWWPPAPGWWVLAALLLIAFLLLTRWWLGRRRRSAASRAALSELARLRAQADAAPDSTALVRELSKLLRRYALSIHPRDQVAALTGEDWLRFLDAHGGGGRFGDGPGRQLLEAPYRPVNEVAPGPLLALVEDWIRRNREGRA